MSRSELLFVDGSIWVLLARTGVAAYDFDFRPVFPCQVPWQRPASMQTVARIGPFGDYDEVWRATGQRGMQLVHSPAQHRLASQLSEWYPRISDLTPRSRVYDVFPSLDEVEAEFGWPVFVKGNRQTSRRKKSLAILCDRDEFEAARRDWKRDSILRWQKVVCREFLRLRAVEDTGSDRIPTSFEFRTFWWKGTLAGSGRYWWEGARYDWTESEQTEGLSVAEEAVRKIDVPFLVVDIAQTFDGRWIVIDCNDGQESGYAGVSPIGLWQKIIGIERELRHGAPTCAWKDKNQKSNV